MIYILVEQTLNGTVTMNSQISGIKAKSFNDAVRKLLSLQTMSKAKDIKKSSKELTFVIEGELFNTAGTMSNQPLNIII
jgi:hypothetical protein